MPRAHRAAESSLVLPEKRVLVLRELGGVPVVRGEPEGLLLVFELFERRPRGENDVRLLVHSDVTVGHQKRVGDDTTRLFFNVIFARLDESRACRLRPRRPWAFSFTRVSSPNATRRSARSSFASRSPSTTHQPSCLIFGYKGHTARGGVVRRVTVGHQKRDDDRSNSRENVFFRKRFPVKSPGRAATPPRAASQALGRELAVHRRELAVHRRELAVHDARVDVDDGQTRRHRHRGVQGLRGGFSQSFLRKGRAVRRQLRAAATSRR